MNWLRWLLGDNRLVSGAVLVVASLVAFGARLVVTALEPTTHSAPSPVLDTALARFLWYGLPLLAAVGYAYWNDGWLVSVGVVYVGLTARPSGLTAYVPTYSPLVDFFWSSLQASLVLGTGCYLVGIILRYIVFRARRPSRASG